MQSGDGASSRTGSSASKGLKVLVTVREAVQRDIDALPIYLAESGLAAAALRVADDIDSADTRPAARSMLSKELRECLSALMAQAPPAKTNDRVDEVNEQRNRRRAEQRVRRGAASADRGRS